MIPLRTTLGLLLLIVCMLLAAGCAGEMVTKGDAGNPTLTDNPVENGRFWIKIDPIKKKIAGDSISINAVTNLPVGSKVICEVYPMYLPLNNLNRTIDAVVTSGIGGLNKTDVTIESAGMLPENYSFAEFFVIEGTLGGDVKDGAVFSLDRCAYSLDISPVGPKKFGDKFTITSTTNLPVDKSPFVIVLSLSNESSRISGQVNVIRGSDGRNITSFTVDTSRFFPVPYDKYRVTERLVENGNETFGMTEFSISDGSRSQYFITIDSDTSVAQRYDGKFRSITNLTAGTKVMWEIRSEQDQAIPILNGTITVTKGADDTNEIYVIAGTSGFNPGQPYFLTEKAVSFDAQDFERFYVNPVPYDKRPIPVITPTPPIGKTTPKTSTSVWIMINPIGDHAIGEKFSVKGTTNLPAGEDLFVDVYSAKPVTFTSGGAIGPPEPPRVKIKEGVYGTNTWMIDIDTTYLKTGEYIVSVSAVKQNAHASQRFNLTKAQTTASSSLIKQGNLKWTYPVKGVKAAPKVVHGKVFIETYDGDIYALDPATGKTLWNFSENSHYTNLVFPTEPKGILYVGYLNGKTFALDEKTGSIIRTYTTDYVDTVPAVSNGIVYIKTTNEKIYAFNADTGNQIWNYSASPYRIIHKTTVGDGLVTFITDGKVWALDTSTGKIRWTTPAKDVQTSSAIFDGVIYAGNVALDEKSGSVLWQNQIENPGFGTITDGMYYTGSFDGKIYALDTRTGAQKWIFETGHKNMLPGHSAGDGIVYFENLFNGQTYALNENTGQLVWTHITNDRVEGFPVISDGIVYVGGEYGYLYALNAKTGELEWSFSTDDGIRFSPAVDNGTVYFWTDGGIVYAVSPP